MISFTLFSLEKESTLTSEGTFTKTNETISNDSVFKSGLPYSSHHKTTMAKSDNVIYIPSSEEEFNAEISRLEYNDKSTFDISFPNRDGSYQSYDNLLQSFMFNVHRTNHPFLNDRNGTNNKGLEGTNAKPIDDWKLVCGEHDVTDEIIRVGEPSSCLLSEQALTSLDRKDNNDITVSVARYKTQSHVKRENVLKDADFDVCTSTSPLHSVEDNVQNNFVEINILSIDSNIENDATDKNVKNVNEINSKNLREIVRTLIKKIFESPRKSMNYMPVKTNYEHKHKEIKISVDELYKDDKLDFIVENRKKADRFASMLKSKKFVFLQLCFLAVLSIYLLSYYNVSHPFKF